MPDRRPSIPENVKREVRRQCYFGCVICGMPFFEYDHIDAYSANRVHDVDNLALLCPTHHAAKTTKKLSADRVREARGAPFNSGSFSTSPLKFEAERAFEVILGASVFGAPFNGTDGIFRAIWNSGTSYVRLDCIDGFIAATIILTDNSGQPILTVMRGEMTLATRAFDFRFEGQRLRVWTAPKECVLDMQLSGNKFHLKKGLFYNGLDGFEVDDVRIYGIIGGVRSGFMLEECAIFNTSCALGIWRKSIFKRDKPPGIAFCLSVDETLMPQA